jgi:hypothetical protein
MAERQNPQWEDQAYWSGARITVISAKAWHVVAELFRRYQRSHDLRVWEFHPGISTRCVLAVQARPADSHRPVPQLDLNLGGPSGSCTVMHRFDGVPGSSEGYPYATKLLHEDPARVIDEIAGIWGLPQVAKLPASTSSTIAARCIAGFLLRQSLGLESYRASSAFVGQSTCDVVAGWVRPLLGVGPVSFDGMLVAGESAPDPGLWRRANRYWLLHRCDAAGGPVSDRASLASGGVVFDMAKGTAARLNDVAMGPAFDLVDLYRKSGRTLDPLVDWVTRSLGACQDFCVRGI